MMDYLLDVCSVDKPVLEFLFPNEKRNWQKLNQGDEMVLCEKIFAVEQKENK